MSSTRSPITRRAAAALALSAPIGLAAVAASRDDERAKPPGPARNPKDDAGAMEAWWTDLEKWETDATRALLNMADRREEAVAFLKAKMKPLKITAAEVRALLLKLGNDSDKVWKPAFEELEYFDPRLAIDLETLMDRYKEAPGRQRMVEVLSGREAGKLAGLAVELHRLGRADGFNFVAKGLLVGRAPGRSHQRVRSLGQPQEEVDPGRARHRAAGALRHPGGRGHPRGHGDRTSRRPAHQGGQGCARTPGQQREINQPSFRRRLGGRSSAPAGSTSISASNPPRRARPRPTDIDSPIATFHAIGIIRNDTADSTFIK